MNEILKDFPQRTAKALELLIEFDWYEVCLTARGADVCAVLDDCGRVRCTVILRDAGPFPWEKLSCYDRELTRDGDGYQMTGEYFDPKTEQTGKLELHFRDAEVELEVFQAESIEDKPWELLARLAEHILFKAEFGDDLLNGQEHALMPLLRELDEFGMNGYGTSRFDGFRELRNRIERYGFRELEKPLAKLEAVYGTKKWPGRINFLRAVLNRGKYEPLWREIYQAITESQAEYPRQAEAHPDLVAVRRRIEWKMHQQGYCGKYPDFYREGQVRGLRMVEFYDQSWLIGNEKRAVFHIHCDETAFFDELCIRVRCGTELLKRGQKPSDIHHCRFDNKGRTIFRTIYYNSSEEASLEQMLTVAMKRAELRKLDKAERKIDGDTGVLGVALVWLILGGGMFALMGMAALAILGTAVLWATEGCASAMELMGSLPWGWLTAIAWLGFGGGMAIVTALAKRN